LKIKPLQQSLETITFHLKRSLVYNVNGVDTEGYNRYSTQHAPMSVAHGQSAKEAADNKGYEVRRNCSEVIAS
jgi:hypothetical protein